MKACKQEGRMMGQAKSKVGVGLGASLLYSASVASRIAIYPQCYDRSVLVSGRVR